MWSVDPASLKLTMADETRQKEREFIREFAVPPASAVTNPDLGGWLIGLRHKLSPSEMAAVLDKLVQEIAPGQPDSMGRRESARKTAAALVAAGRRAEAVEVLLRVVRSAAETRSLPFFLDTLRVIAADLAPLDRPKADLLLAESRRLTSTKTAQTGA
jgi:hypothetical protein